MNNLQITCFDLDAYDYQNERGDFWNSKIVQIFDLSREIPGGNAAYPNYPLVSRLDDSSIIIDEVKNFYVSRLHEPYNSSVGTGTLSVGEPTHPLEQIFLRGDRQTVKHADFKKRCMEGEIIVGDYLIERCSIKTRLIGEIIQTAVMMAGRPYTSSLPTYGYKRCEGSLREGLAFGNYFYCPNEFPRIEISRKMFSRPSDTSFFGATFTPEMIYQKLHEESQLHRPSLSLQQSALAEANSKDIDMLTAIAETPETVQSVIDGLKTITRIVKDAKAKEVKIISRAGTIQQEKAQKAYNLFLARKKRSVLKNFSSKKYLRQNPGKNMADYHAEVQRRLKNIESLELYAAKRATRFRRDAAIEIADELSALQLNVQYNIMPTVYLIQDAERAIRSYGNVYASTRKKDTPFGVDCYLDNTLIMDATVTNRCFIKRRYQNDTTSSKLSALIMSDIIVTAFEKIKLWSIIIDWFYGVTDFIKSINWNPDHIEQGATISHKFEGRRSFAKQVTFSSGEKGVVEFDIDYSFYDRDKISPYPSGIYWRNNMNFTKSLSALAFTWQLMLGRPVKNYSWN